MLLSVATDKRTQLPRGELYTNMALNGARTARETSSPVRPSLVYCIADSFYGATTIFRGSHSVKW
jgi:hypothetical protein